MIKIKVPGKLFISGEYAAIFPASHSLIVPVNRYLTAEIYATNTNYSLIKSEQQELKIDFFNLNIEQKFSEFWQPVVSALQAARSYLIAKNQPLKNFVLDITSELNHPAYGKIGLGSSGAVTVATIKAILYLSKIELTNEDLFCCSLKAQREHFAKSSFGDLAIAVYQKPLYYQKPPSLDKLGLIQPFDWPSDWQIFVGFTGHPFKTEVGVTRFNELSENVQNNFCQNINHLTTKLYKALIEQTNPTEIFQEIADLYWRLDREEKIGIFTTALKKLILTARALKIPAKQSGAGGGDCGIAIGLKECQNELFNSWQKAQIMPLNLEVIT
ncbi:mevalonate kinase family protein [Xylocopilactobacillus apicola]|uniref:phosphomevalonate kinase n=1 Tax=Xylocopilactobacillus apicola TaxID=2932184 RepID=A0AAU9D7L5_9LACO|nr:hypothetical protein [Xylocopilactobacillus apicola]BDR58376.1 phosphomevalonate kinase [Xylocopilactobacillus apicola]